LLLQRSYPVQPSTFHGVMMFSIGVFITGIGVGLLIATLIIPIFME
jgi:hypothetical protein